MNTTVPVDSTIASERSINARAVAKTIVAWSLHPSIVIGGVYATHVMLARGVPGGLAVSLPVMLVTVSLLILERVMPHRRDWAPDLRSVVRDFSHNLLSTSGTSAIIKAVAFGALFELSARLATYAGGSLWPRTLPLALQFAFALVVKEFGFYWSHRLMHTTSFGWRIHALHHSSEQLHTLSSGRTHPINVVLTYLVPLAPVILLGASPEVLALIAVFTGLHGQLQHANIDMRYGVLNVLFATADMHRRHHSVEMSEGNSNFGNNLLVWDHIFGTFGRNPGDRTARVGIAEVEFPQRFVAQLLSPFTYGRMRRR